MRASVEHSPLSMNLITLAQNGPIGTITLDNGTKPTL